MTPLLLTLASLTPGDGGPGGTGAREAVAVAGEQLLPFEGTWEGTWEGHGERPGQASGRVEQVP